MTKANAVRALAGGCVWGAQTATEPRYGLQNLVSSKGYKLHGSDSGIMVLDDPFVMQRQHNEDIAVNTSDFNLCLDEQWDSIFGLPEVKSEEMPSHSHHIGNYVSNQATSATSITPLPYKEPDRARLVFVRLQSK